MKPENQTPKATLAALLANLKNLILQPGSDETKAFSLVGQAPDWLSQVRPSPSQATSPPTVDPVEWFPFLDSFLPTANEAWATEAFPSPAPRSGWWTETALDGSPLEFEASAHRLGRECFLVVRLLDTDHKERSQLLQKARDLALSHERMMSESSKKEILLHCIIHDLSGPLSGMQGCWEMLENESLSPQGQRFLQLGKLEAEKQSNFIRDLLDVFSMEVRTLEEGSSGNHPPPDLVKAIQNVSQGISPAFEIKGVKLRLDFPPDLVQPCLVRGETSRLERILYNLLQNALLHSPPNSTVNIQLSEQPDGVTVSVEDEGPGVPENLASRLFQKFIKAAHGPGKAGLGLFFCRITLERWGGSIKYQAGRKGGSSFQFTIPKAIASDESTQSPSL